MKMIKMNDCALGSLKITNKYASGLIIYDKEDKLLENKIFMEYVEKVLDYNGEVFFLNKGYVEVEDYFIAQSVLGCQHSLVNQVMIFESGKILKIILLEDLFKIFQESQL